MFPLSIIVKCCRLRGEHEEQQSDYHIDTSSDSLFRTPLTTTRARKRRSVIDDAVITTPDGAASPSPVSAPQLEC
uniref:Uncharacterized protein n=1 Tax=Parascaris equorum TaxID=6256 RepID=A0A914RJ98_PAREQ